MPIAALPSQTVRAIGSTQTLTDSASVVKELVDNALDAQATSISIEVSTNILDIIQVKDNGHGIPETDRPLVCKRYCTSKIRDLEDLAKIGGHSLGFRGEALASAVEMSGGLTVTTRVVGETTAASLKVSQDGEVAQEDRVSHALGTTVRIIDFLKSLPVRRQTAIKESTKQLAKIKRLLQAYALARPSVRLSLRVLKAKSDRANWIYAPKSNTSVLDAAVNVVGKKVSGQCRWVVWNSNTLRSSAEPTHADNTDTPKTSLSTYQVEALIPKSDAGTLKQIVQLFKSYVRSSCNSSIDQKITGPFLCMNLVCPTGSYDPNVEPAKDDVLFANSPSVLELVEAFLKSQYGELQSKNKQTTSSKTTATDSRNFELLLARKQPLGSGQPSTSSSIHKHTIGSSPTSRIKKSVSANTRPDEAQATYQTHVDERIVDQIGGVRYRVTVGGSDVSQSPSTHPANSVDQRWRQSIYPDENDDQATNTNGAPQNQDFEDEEELRDIRVSNPWTFAKLNAPVRAQGPTASIGGSVSRNQQLLTPAKQLGKLGDDLFSPELHPGPITDPTLHIDARSQIGMLYEASSPETFPYPIKRWGKVQQEADRRRTPPHNENSSPTRLDTWIQRPPPQSGVTSQEPSHLQDDLVLDRPQRDFILASELPQGTPLDAIPDISQAPRRKGGPLKQQHLTSSNAVNKPFKPPAVHDPDRVWFDHLDPPSARPSKVHKGWIDNSLPLRPPNRIAANDIDHDPILDEHTPLGQQQHHPGLALTMDYEARKAAATAQRRAFLRQEPNSTKPAQQLVHLDSASQQSTKIKNSPSQQSSLPSSPHLNRYNSAIAALHTTPPHSNIPPTPNTALSILADAAATTSPHTKEAESETKIGKMNPKDPRAYLIRCCSKPHNNDGKIKRTRSTLLPLETLSRTLDTADEKEIRNFTQIIDTTSGILSHLSPSTRVHEYAQEEKGTVSSSIFTDATSEEIGVWEERIMDLISRTFPKYEGMEMLLGLDLVAKLKGLTQQGS
ncbi:MAG: hypothetical protein Q9172_006097 [Xanthocarpia lactea]